MLEVGVQAFKLNDTIQIETQRAREGLNRLSAVLRQDRQVISSLVAEIAALGDIYLDVSSRANSRRVAIAMISKLSINKNRALFKDNNDNNMKK